MININKLKIDEKIKLLTGTDLWHLETLNKRLYKVRMADGPNGLRKTYHNRKNIEVRVPSTAYPTASVLASTWNKEMAYLMGKCLADDCISEKVNLLLAPAVNIKRTPLCGRNFEYFSEDPVLSGILAKEYILGVQDKGVGTSLKHFCANNIELDRLFSDSIVSNRALHEIYTRQFEIALQANPTTIMCSYNKIDNIHVSQNKRILKDILRDEYKYEGAVISDWEAVHDVIEAHKAGLDIQMPYNKDAYNILLNGYKNGKITDEEINANVLKILELIEKIKKYEKIRKVEFSKEEKHEYAKKIATEGIVLLKNDENILPLNQYKKIALLGNKCYQPSMIGGGSGSVVIDYKIKNLKDELNNNLSGAQIDYFETFSWERCVFNTLEILNSIQEYDVVCLFIGNNPSIETEGYDRDSIKLTKQQELMINTVLQYNKNLVLILEAGSVIDMSNYVNKVKAIVYTGFAGEAVNEALALLLSGKENFSGKTNETFIYKLEDNYANVFDCLYQQEYKEDIYVGYRYYDKYKIDVCFPFGHGLSYSKFSYSNLKVNKIKDNKLKVSYTITNESNVDGKEISQIYVGRRSKTIESPLKELKGFSKDLIKAHESKEIVVYIDINLLTYFDEKENKYLLDHCYYQIMVGGSSKSLPLKKKILLKDQVKS